MHGWLLVNAFLQKEKFNEIYALLFQAAARRGIELELKTNAELIILSTQELKTLPRPDFVLFWDKDILLARRLEESGFKLFNSAATIEYCDDKNLTALALEKKGVATPKTISAPKTFEGVGYTDLQFFDEAKKRLKLPLVIKEACGSFGQQVYLAETEKEGQEILLKIGCKPFLMQEFIQESRGRDVRVNVVGGRVVSAILRENSSDFRSNITGGGKASAYQVSKAQADAAIAACQAVGADFAGVDILFGKNSQPLVCEINSNPHFKSSLDCTGVDVSEHIMEYVAARIKGE